MQAVSLLKVLLHSKILVLFNPIIFKPVVSLPWVLARARPVLQIMFEREQCDFRKLARPCASQTRIASE